MSRTSMRAKETFSSDDYEDLGEHNDLTDMAGSANDVDAMTVHRRKMMRRAANRRSAQLSRARKKVRVFVLILFHYFYN